jgi:hypothetical protein
MSRFFSSYEEMMLRLQLHHPKVPEKYESFLRPLKGKKWKDYIQMFNSTEGIEQVTHMLEQFVHDYDAKEPFERHLRPQLTQLVDPTAGRTYRLDAIFDTNHMEMGFEQLAKMVNASYKPTTLHARSRKDNKLDTNGLSLETKRKICQLSAIDFCCLNYPLPPECQDAVQCRWISYKSDLSMTTELMIEAVSPFPP